MKKISKLVLTLPIAALALNTVQATEFTVEETRILNRTTLEDMRVVFNSVPPVAGDRTLADMVNRVGGAPDEAILATIDGSGVAATIPAAIAIAKASIGAAAAYNAAQADAAAAIPATGTPGIAGHFIDGTVGAAVGVSGTAGAEDAINEETRSLLRLAFKRLNTGIKPSDGLAPGVGALNDGDDTALGLGLATAALGVATEETLTLAGLVRVLYAIRLKD